MRPYGYKRRPWSSDLYDVQKRHRTAENRDAADEIRAWLELDEEWYCDVCSTWGRCPSAKPVGKR